MARQLDTWSSIEFLFILQSNLMKTSFTIALLICFSQFYNLGAQPCDVHAFHAQSQQDLDDFSILHGTCEEFNGSIYISGINVKNLDVISQLKVIHGSLTIMNTDVSSIEFPLLQSIGEGLYIENNNKLKKINSFNNLDTVGYDISITRHKFLEEISGFEKLSRVRGVVEINYNQVLKKVDGFTELETIGGALFIFNNSLLNELSSFSSLDSIGYDIDISANLSLKRIENFTSLRVVGRNMHFWDNPKLEYIGNFNVLRKIGIELHFMSNEKLKTIEGFSNLEKLKSFYLNESDTLISIATFASLHAIDSIVEIANSGLENLQFLSELKSVNQDFFITLNNNLINLEGLESLENVGRFLLNRNQNLETTKGLTSFTYCGSMYIIENPNFQKIEDLLMINTTELELVQIERNSQFSDSQSPFLCKLMSEAPTKLSLYRNGPGCSYNIEIAQACQIEAGCNVINVHLANHDDLTDFLEKNQGCTSLNNVFIGQLHHLEGLETIDSIHGYLEFYSASFSNMEVLENISWIGGDLIVSNWHSSQNLEELKNLTHIGGDFIMEFNSSVRSFDGLQSLKTVKGKIFLYFNNFESFGEWPALETVGGLELIANRNLIVSSGFSRLKEITGDFRLTGNSKLEILSGFDSLEKIGGNFNFRNTATHAIAPFESLQEIGGDFLITYVEKLTNMGTHPLLKRIGGNFTLLSPVLLETAEYFPQLTEISGNIYIERANALQSLSFLRHLTTIGGGLELRENSRLISIDAFDSIESIQYILIENWPLKKLNAFKKLKTIGQDFSLNIAQIDTCSLPELQIISGNFFTNAAIKKLSMPQFEELGANFEMRFLEVNNLEGLPKLNKIGGHFQIHNSPMLQNLSGLPDELIIDGKVILFRNSALNWCHSKPICTALQDSERQHEIYLNADGCENLQKVMDECLLLDTEEINTDRISLSIYPNPANDHITIMFDNMDRYPANLNAIIHDIYGQLAFQSKINSESENAEINISGLYPGMYFLSISTADGRNIVTQKIIIQR